MDRELVCYRTHETTQIFNNLKLLLWQTGVTKLIKEQAWIVLQDIPCRWVYFLYSLQLSKRLTGNENSIQCLTKLGTSTRNRFSKPTAAAVGWVRFTSAKRNLVFITLWVNFSSRWICLTLFGSGGGGGCFKAPLEHFFG